MNFLSQIRDLYIKYSENGHYDPAAAYIVGMREGTPLESLNLIGGYRAHNLYAWMVGGIIAGAVEAGEPTGLPEHIADEFWGDDVYGPVVKLAVWLKRQGHDVFGPSQDRDCFNRFADAIEAATRRWPTAIGKIEFLMNEACELTGVSEPTVNKYAELAGVRTRDVGEQNIKWTQDEMKRILRSIIDHSTIAKDKKKATDALAGLS